MIGAWQKKAREQMAKPKKGQTIIIRSHDMINRRFYDGFDHKFLYRKAQTLMFLVREQERFTELVKQAEQAHEDGADLPLLSQDIDDKYFERLRAEVYFCEMHQFEGFFALLLAVFQGIPHWLYLTLYETREIKQAVERYLAGNITAVTSGTLSTVEDFITRTVYGGFSPEERLENSQWVESIECIDWFIKRVGERYLKAEEYNAYKHGLRVLTGHSRFIVQPNDPTTGTPQGTPRILWDSEDSVSFLDFEDKGEGRQAVVEVTKHFNPQESFEHIQIMQLILDEVMRIRRALLKHESPEHVRTIFINKDELHALRKFFTLSLTV